ncbi:TonB family protein [Pseudoduganella flava]|uniref:TonB family protein n=1 Tax=Pseudoduganella flava TaxID=871742 RepID=A0A562PM11_9BURK|nr:energy transducer TonB [Pseudoduganella flava]TWI45449.1 TonB family protein [Pseudoduganella flava]
MTKRVLRHGAVMLALLPVLAVAQTKPVADLNACERPVWPRESLRFEQQGAVTMAFLVGEDRAIREAKIVETSGFPLLDAAARDGVAKCRFKPAMVDGKPQAAWMKMQYVWTLEGDTMSPVDKAYAAAPPEQKSGVAAAADLGLPDAIALLTSAAVRGDAAAQYWQGTRYEAGKGVPANRVAALFWYRKAATSGDQRAAEALARLDTTAQPPAK